MPSLWRLILTLAYITNRLSEEGRECDLVGGRTALLIYPEGQACSLPTLSFFRLLPAGSALLLNLGRPSSVSAVFRHLLPHPTAFCRLPPPTTTFRHLRYLARPWAVTVSPSSVSNTVETSPSRALPPHRRVGVPAGGGTLGGRCTGRQDQIPEAPIPHQVDRL